MIFGFNTDVKHGDTVYHVQSEARERELRLQSQVFVSGRCVAKRASSYADAHARPDFQPEQMHELLRAQHREVLELVRTGQLDKVSTPEKTEPEPEAADDPAPAVAQTEAELPLALAWLNPWAFTEAQSSEALLLFSVSEAGTALADARVVVRLNGDLGPAHYAQAISGADGRALVPVTFDAGAHGDVVALLVQATAQGRSVTRKFHLRRA